MTDTPAPETLRMANDVRRAATALARRLRRLRGDHGVSAARLSVLGHLNRARGGLAAVELARLERLQPQSLTRIIADLDERGLVVRRQDETDRRQILIDITQAGVALLVSDAARQTAWLAEAIDAELSSTEQALLHLAAELVEKLSRSAAGGDL